MELDSCGQVTLALTEDNLWKTSNCLQL